MTAEEIMQAVQDLLSENSASKNWDENGSVGDSSFHQNKYDIQQ